REFSDHPWRKSRGRLPRLGQLNEPWPLTKTTEGRAVISISASNGCVAMFMANSWRGDVALSSEGGAKRKKPHFAGAAFSRTLLNCCFSVVVGHGATHHRRTSDDGKWRGVGSS